MFSPGAGDAAGKPDSVLRSRLPRCRIPVENALRDAKLDLKDLNEVILVGGSTRIPAVQELVTRLAGKKPNVSVNPDEVVALGAAVQAGVLAGEVRVLRLIGLSCAWCSSSDAVVAQLVEHSCDGRSEDCLEFKLEC